MADIEQAMRQNLAGTAQLEDMSRKLGEYPGEVVIFGIQPESMALGDGLSSTLQERLGDYVEMILQELNGVQDA